MRAPTDIGVTDRFGRHWPAMVTRPVSVHYDSDEQIRELLDEVGCTNKPTHLVYGYCRTFCAHDTETMGTPVDQHGAWCKSSAVAHAEAKSVNGERVTLFATLVSPYYHGTYRTSDTMQREEFLELSLSGAGIEPDHEDDAKKLYLTCGEVRRLAAALVHAADALDMIDESPNDNLQRRRNETS